MVWHPVDFLKLAVGEEIGRKNQRVSSQIFPCHLGGEAESAKKSHVLELIGRI